MIPPPAQGTRPQDTPAEDAPADEAVGHEESAIVVEFADNQTTVAVDEKRMVEAVRHVLVDAEWPAATISLAVVDDATIHRINREFLQHDYPTDVLSFALEKSEGWLSGQIMISTETATRNAKEYGQSVMDELLLYAIHGALHLVGYEDDSAEAAAKMRAAESRLMAHWTST